MLDRLAVFAVVLACFAALGALAIVCCWVFLSIVLWEIMPAPPWAALRFFIGIGFVFGVLMAIFAGPDRA